MQIVNFPNIHQYYLEVDSSIFGRLKARQKISHQLFHYPKLLCTRWNQLIEKVLNNLGFSFPQYRVVLKMLLVNLSSLETIILKTKLLFLSKTSCRIPFYVMITVNLNYERYLYLRRIFRVLSLLILRWILISRTDVF